MEIVLTNNQTLIETGISNVVDTYEIGIGQNDRIDLFFSITAAAATADGLNSYVFCAIESDYADMSESTVINRTYEEFIPASVMVDGFEVNIPMACGSRVKRYVSAKYELSGDNPSVGVTCLLKTELI